MKDKLVTVVGGSGFVGRYVVRALLAKGARVRIAARDPRRAFFLKPQGGLGQTQFVAVDVTRPDTVARALRGSDAVVNLVGVLAGDFDRIHVEGARTVAEAAAAEGADALVQISAIGADPESASAYGRSKGLGEQAVRAAFPAATILRPSIVFGREDDFINRFARMLQIAPAMPVVRPQTRFQPVFAGDVGDAVVAALSANTAGQTLELGGPETLTMHALLEWIAHAIGRAPRLIDLPDPVAGTIARLGFLPGAPITWDQWLMLQHDNVVTGTDGLAALNIPATALDTVAPGWLVQYRRRGRFAKPLEA